MPLVRSGGAAHVVGDGIRKRAGTDAYRQFLDSASVFVRQNNCAEYCIARSKGSDAVNPGDWCRCDATWQSYVRTLLIAHDVMEQLGRKAQSDSSEPLDDDVELASAAQNSDDSGTTAIEGVKEQMISTVSPSISSTSTGTSEGSNLPTQFTHTSVVQSSSTLVVHASTTAARNGSTAAAPSFTSVAAAVNHINGNGLEGSGISQSARIGLGVGFGLGIPILLAFLAFWCLYRRKRKKRSTDPNSGRQGQSDMSKVEESQRARQPTGLEERRTYHYPGMLVLQGRPVFGKSEPKVSFEIPTGVQERQDIHYPGKSGLQDRQVFRRQLPQRNSEMPAAGDPAARSQSKRQTRPPNLEVIVPSGSLSGGDAISMPSPVQEWSPLSRVSSVSAVSRVSSRERSPRQHL